MQIKNIVIDRGNSSFKLGLFEGRKLMEAVVLKNKEEVVAFVMSNKPVHILYCSVTGNNKKLLQSISSVAKVIKLNHKTPLPFKNVYATPKSLGPDRLAAVAAANDKFKGQDCLVIDAGTCITYDFIDKENNYQGGAISPGIQMRFNALHHFTAKLPQLKKVGNPKLTGNNTKSSMESGVINGVIAEVRGTIDQYQFSNKDLKVVLCGGDSIFFESKIKGHIFAVANLVLIGLNRILLYNLEDFEGIH